MSGQPSRWRTKRTRRSEPPNAPGAHALADHTAVRLVREARIRPTDLVFDLGAGLGAITVPLAATGARVVAVEREPRLARRLAAAVDGSDNVRVVAADALSVPLPCRPFVVVANIPFAITTALLRRLVDAPLDTAHLVVEHGAARRFSTLAPGRPELLAWQAAFEFRRLWRVPATSFRPRPSVDAAVLRIRRRPQPPRSGSPCSRWNVTVGKTAPKQRWCATDRQVRRLSGGRTPRCGRVRR